MPESDMEATSSLFKLVRGCELSPQFSGLSLIGFHLKPMSLAVGRRGGRNFAISLPQNLS